MVAEQIASRDIVDPKVLRAMAAIPREKFVPPQQRHLAYTDQPLAIGNGQTISQPYVVAFMSQMLRLNKSLRVLEIGTGSGYQAAVISRIAKEVYTVEIIKPLLDNAQKTISGLNFRNVYFKHDNGRQGWKEYAPYDRIIVTAASKDIPPPLIRQLADNGLMIIPLGHQHWTQNLVIVTKKKRQIYKEKILPVRFVPLVNKHKRKAR
ncbi:MAG: protein-L-isoaspartate(D-aspartate) O-methyltransferase [Candidatus Marinimicrobia bacterium]|nr:protein-L-isoaspartate(D-aspartate) O-methyltransferase [Candidatus Neomarinimicrobiota bacterium]